MIFQVQAEKKTSWIELYFDLVFVLVVAQVAHVVSAGPGWRAVWTGLGLFAVLWWTWVGFAMFYNRYGDETKERQRFVVILGTVPCGLAAVAVHDFPHTDRIALTLSLAAVRVVLAVAHLPLGRRLALNVALGYLASAAGFVVSLFLPSPWWWLLWGALILGESFNLFDAHRRYPALSEAQVGEISADWRRTFTIMKPTDPEYALQSPHLAERFGLFMIILLGEVVASAGTAASGHVSWWSVAGAFMLSAALWWSYFDSSARINERLLSLSAGSPEIARSVFAFGHMFPAFGLIMAAGGLQLLVPAGASPGYLPYWLVSIGVTVYLLGTTVNAGDGRQLRMVLQTLTVLLGLLGLVVSPLVFIWVMCAWVALCAYVADRPGAAPEI
jgi:low temperature requirement protein LtrA